jgi:hypothetical protein
MGLYYASCRLHYILNGFNRFIFVNYLFIHTHHSRFIPEGVAEESQIFETPTFYQNYLAMRNNADVIGGKPIAVSLSILGVNAINSLVAFYDI